MGDLIYLPTGIEALDSILAMDKNEKDEKDEKGKKKQYSKGILIGKGTNRKDFETPIILIGGATGTGKTTLALQIAFSAARQEKWLTCFYALEQPVQSLKNSVENFGYFKNVNPGGKSDVELCDLADPKEVEIKFGENLNKINICHLSPRPISDVGKEDIFETRFSELSHIIKKIDDEIDNKIFIVFIIDSLTAFSSNVLSRNDIHRIFSLFRNHNIPAILTIEQYQGYLRDSEFSSFECAKFLSDIVINLSKDNSKGYLLYYLEIEKSRVCRQGLGKHLYKIRTAQNAKNIITDPRTGIVLYPSIHSILSMAREENLPKPTKDFLICKKNDDLWNIIQSETIKPGECFTITGLAGTHKLALGMNLSMGYIKDKSPKLLIVNFGGSGDFKFEGIAWTKNRTYCSKFEKPREPKTNGSQIKFWYTHYSCNMPKFKKKASAIIATFKIGQLAPEECFYVIDSIINENAKKNDPFSSVLLSDTAELCNGFPLLSSDPLFLPALVDLFETHNLVSVCIGVDSKQSKKNADINFSLLSRADYRIVLSHYPEIYELSKQIIQTKLLQKGPPYLREQLVSLVIDNVTGKHYSREPRWLWVEEKSDNEKILHCDFSPPSDFLIEKK